MEIKNLRDVVFGFNGKVNERDKYTRSVPLSQIDTSTFLLACLNFIVTFFFGT